MCTSHSVVVRKPPKELQVSDLKEVNAVMRIKSEPIAFEELTFVCYMDSGFAIAPNKKCKVAW